MTALVTVQRPRDTRRRWRVLVLLAASSLTPVLLYFLTRPYVGSDTTALAVSAAAPAVVTVAAAVWRRQLRILSVLTVVGLGVALAATAVSGGSSLPLKLYRPMFTGAVGMAFLLSTVLRRPLLGPALRTLAGRGRFAIPPHRSVTVLTALVGVTLLVEATAIVVLALTVSTGTFLIASRIARVSIFAAGLAAATWYVRRRRPALRPTGHEIESAGRRPWFGPRRLGVGWGRPQTWQARLIVLGVLVLVVVLRLVFGWPGR